MATKNLVPRIDNEGELGISTRRWKSINAASGYFNEFKANKLKNIAGNDLFQADVSDTITITYDESNNVYKLASTNSGGGVSSFFELSEIKTEASSVSASQILVYDATGDPSTEGFYTRSVTGDITVDSTGKMILDKSLFLSARNTPLAQLASSEVADSDRLLICDFDSTTESNSSLKYITKSDFLSGFTTTFIGLSDTENSWQNGNLVKAVVTGTNITFAPDANTYLTSVDFNEIATSNLPSEVVLDTALPDSTGIIKITVDGNDAKTMQSITDNSANWDSAYGWGDHSAANYVENDGTVHFSLSQDIQLNTSSGGPFTITNVPLPTEDNDIANKTYVDSVASGLSLLAEVRCATTVPIILAGLQTIDTTVILVENDRVLVKDQSDTIDNGIYVCAQGAWTRATDFASTHQASGSYTFIEEGSLNSKKGFVCTSNSANDTVGTHEITWAIFSSAGDFTSGSGLSLSNSGAFSLDLNQGLTDIALNDSDTAVVKSDDVIPIKDTSSSNSTNVVTIEKLLTDLTDNDTLEIHNALGLSKIRIKDEGVTLSKIKKISQHKILGNLDTTTTLGSVAEIDVARESDRISGQLNVSEWETPSDTKISTQSSIKNYVESRVSALENPPVKIGVPNDIKSTVYLGLNTQTGSMIGDVSDWIDKVYQLKLDHASFWEKDKIITVKLPRLIIGSQNGIFKNLLRGEVENHIDVDKFYLLFDWSDVDNISYWHDNKEFNTPEIFITHNLHCGIKDWSTFEKPGEENFSNYTEEQARDQLVIGSFSVIQDPADVDEFMYSGQSLTTNIRLPFRTFSDNQWLNTKALYECGLSLHRFNFDNSSIIKGWSLILKIKRIS